MRHPGEETEPLLFLRCLLVMTPSLLFPQELSLVKVMLNRRRADGAQMSGSSQPQMSLPPSLELKEACHLDRERGDEMVSLLSRKQHSGLCTQLTPSTSSGNILHTKGKAVSLFLLAFPIQPQVMTMNIPDVRVSLVLRPFWPLQRLQGLGSRSCSAPTSCVTLGKPERLSES